MAAELNKYLGKLLALLTLLHHCASWHTEDVLLLHRYLLASKEIPFETYNVKLIVPELLDMDNKALLMASPTRYFVASSNGSHQQSILCKNEDHIIIDLSGQSFEWDTTVSEAELWTKACFWLFLDSAQNRAYLDQNKPGYDSRVYLVETVPLEMRLILKEFYSIKNDPLIERIVETWEDGNLTRAADFIWERRRDLNGTTLVGAFHNHKPSIYVTIPEGGDINAAYGFNIDILKMLMNIMNFTITLEKSPDIAFGTPDEDGNWNGIIGMLQRGDAEISVTVLRQTSERSQVIRHGLPLLGHKNILVTNNTQNGQAYKSVFSMVELNVWCLVMLLVVAIGCVSMAIHRLHHKKHGKRFCVPDCVLTTFGLVVSQGAPEQRFMPPSLRNS